MNTYKLLDYIGFTFLVATIVLLQFSERLLDNVIKAKSFLMEYAIYGTILSATTLILIYKTKPDYYIGGEKRASAVLSYFFGVIFLFVFGSAYYNVETAKKNLKPIPAFVIDKSLNIRYKTPYLTLQIENRKERFQPKINEWNNIKEKDTILLTVGQGQLGYDYIFTFLTNHNLTTDDQNGSR